MAEYTRARQPAKAINARQRKPNNCLRPPLTMRCASPDRQGVCSAYAAGQSPIQLQLLDSAVLVSSNLPCLTRNKITDSLIDYITYIIPRALVRRLVAISPLDGHRKVPRGRCSD